MPSDAADTDEEREKVPESIADHGATATVLYLILKDADRPVTAREVERASRRPWDTVRVMLPQLTKDDDTPVVREPDPTDRRFYRYSIR